MIDKDHHARLAVFSPRMVILDRFTFSSSYTAGGAVPWMGPELLDPESFGLKKSCPTKESDCYALGMVIYEVLSGQKPFAPLTAPVLRITRGDRPKRPQGERGAVFTDEIWRMLECCWKHQPKERINAEAILRGLGGMPYPSRTPSDVGGDTDTESDGQSYAAAGGSSVFSPLRPWLTSNCSGGITVLPTSTHGDDELPVPPLDSPPRVPSPVFPGQFPDPPQVDNQNEGWISDWLAHTGWGMFSAAI